MALAVPLVLSVISILIALYAVRVSLRSETYARAQVELMQEQAKKSEEKEREELQWAERHERLATRLSRITPNLTIGVPDAKSNLCLYPSVFQDAQFRSKLETYVVDLNASGTEFRPHKATPHELRLRGLRDTVAAAEQLIEKFVKENPKIQLMNYFGVEPKV
jgi:hypothetical protein